MMKLIMAKILQSDIESNVDDSDVEDERARGDYNDLIKKLPAKDSKEFWILYIFIKWNLSLRKNLTVF